MIPSFYDEEPLEVCGEKLTLAIDFGIIDIIEHTASREDGIVPMPNVVAMLYAAPPPLSVSGKVLWALLRRHHEEVTMDQAAGLMFSEHGNRVAIAMLSLINRAMNLGEPRKEKGKNPRKPRGPSKPS